MRIISFLLFALLFQVHAIDSYGQESRVSLTASGMKLGQFFKAVEKQTDFMFFYVDSDIEGVDVNVNVKEASVMAALNQALAKTGLTYEINDRYITILPARLPEKTQGRSITGTVTDEAGDPMPGMNVVLKGTTTGVATDVDGKYSINVPNGNTVLIFSFIGYITQEITVGERTVVDIIMEEDARELEEVVVVGYGVQKKVNLTGAVSQINSEKMSLRPAANTGELLQGMIAGLVTQQSSGLPGSDGTTLNIRGYGNNPLVLIDGIESGLGQVDPNDIESVSVLKDASAAIYGARAGNGVILVTTKRGKEGMSEISYHGTVSITQPTFLAKQVNALQWAEMMHEAGWNPDDFSPSHVHYDPAANTLTNILDGSNYKGYNWRDALFRNWTPQTQHNLNVRGGTERIRYFFSVGYTRQESNFTAGEYTFNRYNIRSNIDAKVTKNISASIDLAYRKTVLDRAYVDLDELFNQANHSYPVYPITHEADPTRASYSGSNRTPLPLLYKDQSGFVDNRNHALQGSVSLKYDVSLIPGLSAKASLAFEEIYGWRKESQRPYTMWEYDAMAANEGRDPWINRGSAGRSDFSVTSSRNYELMPRLVIEYIKNTGDHNLHIMAIGEMWSLKDNDIEAKGRDLFSYETPYLKYLATEGQSNDENASDRARISYIGRVNYDFRQKYLVELAMRTDASAEYPSKGRWGYFPSISTGWRISEENFIKNNFSFVNSLKLRASYGVLGNDAVSSFAYLSGFNITGQNYVFGASAFPTINSAGVPNPDITWETMKISNIGLEGVFLNGLIGFEIDAFYRTREGILAKPLRGLPSTFGAAMPQMNLNKRDIRGFELMLTHKNHIGGVSYEIAPMISWSRGKYVKLEENHLPVDNSVDEETRQYNSLWNRRYTNEGHWDDREWGYLSNGFFMNQQEIDDHPVNQDQNDNVTLKPGDLKYKDLNSDGIIDWRDQTVIGLSGLPKTMYSLNISASWKGLSLFMLWQGATNYSVRFDGAAANAFQNNSVPLDIHYKHRAILETDADGNQYISNPNSFKLPPALQTGRSANNSEASDFYRYEARYLRLKTLTLSYSLPQKWMQIAGISSTMFYVNATNLITFSDLGIWKNSFDPEITEHTNRQYPPVKTLTFGLKLTL